MKQLSTSFKKVLLVLILAIPVLANAFEPAKNLQNGTIYLKGGETLTGQISPLGDFANNGTVFQANANSKKTIIAHDRIEKIVIGDMTLIPSTVEVNGSKVAAYLEQKTEGSANLYKAYFFGTRELGKNNASTQMLWSWVVSTSHHGAIALGHNPKPSQLAKVLDHPVVSFSFDDKKLDENNIVKIVEDYNSAVAANNGEGPRF